MRPLWLLFTFVLCVVAGIKATDTFKDEEVDVKKGTCTCSFSLVLDGKDCRKKSSGTCNKDCVGLAKGYMLTGKSGNKYELKLLIKKGQVKFKYCKLATDTKPPKPSETIIKVEIIIPQTWSQEPAGYDRIAVIQYPKSKNSKKKFPVVIDLHGFGGKGTFRFGRTLASAVLVAPTAYQPIGHKRQWNTNANPNHSYSASKAPDVEFILKLIEIVGEKVAGADMKDVTIIGSSMGGAMLQRLMIEVPSPQPFHRAIPLYGMLNTDQFHDGTFWMSSEKDMKTVPVDPPKPGPEFIYFHGDKDRTVTYLGGAGVGPNVFLGAQKATYTWARYWGETGPQLSDEEGKVLDSGMVEYSYLGGKVVHYKLPGAVHTLKPYDKKVYEMIKERVIG